MLFRVEWWIKHNKCSLFIWKLKIIQIFEWFNFKLSNFFLIFFSLIIVLFILTSLAENKWQSYSGQRFTVIHYQLNVENYFFFYSFRKLIYVIFTYICSMLKWNISPRWVVFLERMTRKRTGVAMIHTTMYSERSKY